MRKRRVDNTLPVPEKDLEFKAGDNKEYEFETLIDSAIYGQQANDNDQILSLYYFVLEKSYPEEKNTSVHSLTVIHLRKLISTFYKEHPEKSIVISLPLYFIPLMASLSVPKEQK